MKLIEKCPICNKTLELVGSVTFGLEKLSEFKCGHFFAAEAVTVAEESLDFTSANGNGFSARDYQKDGIKFIIASDFACIIGDQMRLGKTPQALLALKNRYDERTPCLIIVRSANIWQWIREYKIWTDPCPLGIYPIIGTESFIPPGFSTYIISMDTFSRKARCKHCKHVFHDQKCSQCAKHGETCRVYEPAGDDIVEKLLKFGFKLVIADEAHSFKNSDSNRSQAIVRFLHDVHQSQIEREYKFNCIFCHHEWSEICKLDINVRSDASNTTTTKYTNCPKCNARVGQVQQKMDKIDRNNNCGIVLLTGTAVKNRADEYFIPLNLVTPTRVPSLDRFRRRWLMQDQKGAWSRINPYCYDAFKKEFSDVILRREKEDVYTDLPPLNRMFTLIEPDKDSLSKQYNKILDQIEAKMAERVNPTYWDYAENLMQLRRICGLMKLPWTADYCETNLMDSDESRIAVGIHHKDVRDLLKFKLSHIGAITLSGEDSAEKKDWIMRSFASTPERVLIINMLAGGVGMDFHYVNNIIILERQWSFADEEQFEFRFYNPDKSIKTASTSVEYILAKGTLDEWWYNMIEGKKCIQGETIGSQWDIRTQPHLFKELINETISHRL